MDCRFILKRFCCWGLILITSLTVEIRTSSNDAVEKLTQVLTVLKRPFVQNVPIIGEKKSESYIPPVLKRPFVQNAPIIGEKKSESYIPHENFVIAGYDKKNDYKDMLEIFNEAHQWLFRNFPSKNVELKYFNNELKKSEKGLPGALTWDVVRSESKTVGFVSYSMTNNKHIGHITLLAVQKDYRRKGLGGALMRHALKQLESQGAKVVTIQTAQTNLRAQQLYKDLGFNVYQASRDTLYLMKKML